LNIKQIEDILMQVKYLGYEFTVKSNNGVMYLQAYYVEPDIVSGKPETQHTRKWQLSEHMVKSEIVQTAFKCVITSAEHRVREHFLYKGKRIFGPHFDVDALVEICEQKRLDYRKDG
jgi:hypothetical protein